MISMRWGRAVVLGLLVLCVLACDDDDPTPVVNPDVESAEVPDEPQDASDAETASASADASTSDTAAGACASQAGRVP